MFIKGISYWSFSGGLEGSKPVAEAFVQARQAGFEAVEVCLSEMGDVSLRTDEKAAAAVVRAAADAGVQISSVATGLFWGKSLTASDPKVRSEALDIGRKLIDVAAWLDAGAVLVVPGAVDVFFDPAAEVVDYGSVYRMATDAVGELLPRAQAAGITLAVENVWNKFLVGPMELAGFVDQFKSDSVGCYFDVGNCTLVGYPEHWIRVLARRIKRVHLKDFRRGVGTADGFVDLLSGDVNWPEVMNALQDVGYEGFLTAEMIPLYRYYPEVLLYNTSRAMDAILNRP